LWGVGTGFNILFDIIFPSSRKEFLVDWNAIKTEYIAGGTSYRKLCEKYGVSRTTLQRKAKDENWVELRSQAQAKAETKIVTNVSRKQAETANKIIIVADKLLDKIAEIIE
jgi:Zn-dependent peptidase ImmA (M78 family)